MRQIAHRTTGVVVSSLLAGLLVGVAAGRWAGGPGGPDGTPTPTDEQDGTIAPVSTTDRAHAFLERYVDDTGRVVRIDQGGDTVSEGQAYAMLIALGVRAEGTFDRIWSWTRTNLQRPDGLLSWHWQAGSVADRQSAADADLDAARALVVAGRVFGRPGLTRAGRSMGAAILRVETVRTPDGRVLLPGPWTAHRPPYLVNPSYFSPVAARLLFRATGDRRWAQLEAGGRAVLRRLAGTQRLIPDWAQVDASGAARPTTGPHGEPVASGFEAGRSVVRLAESCSAADRKIAASQRPLLTRDSSAYAVLGLTGLPLVGYATPLAWTSRAAALAASGRPTAAARALVNADGLALRLPTYYGDAWEVLGRMMLGTRSLGGCPAGVTA